MRATVVRLVLATALVAVLGAPGPAYAEDRERGFVDLYAGVVRLFEADVPDWKFQDVDLTYGGRVGVWIGPNWGLTFRAWHFITDAKQEGISPSDLAFLGLSLELIARWPLSDRWAIYGSLGPMVGIATLDRQRPETGREDDSRSAAPGMSASVGTEFQIYRSIRGFTEVQGTLGYPRFEFPDHAISPRLLTINGLVGVRLGF